MNKYKKGFTPDEAALIAVGLDKYSTIDSVTKQVNDKITGLIGLGIVLPPHKVDSFKHAQNQLDEQEQIKESIDEANLIKVALIEETLISHQWSKGNRTQSTNIEIYLPFYDENFNGEFDPELTQITKDSLAKWFNEAGELEIENKFKTIPKVEKINLFKKGFTAEQAALIATQLYNYNSLSNATEVLDNHIYQEAELQWQAEKGDCHHSCVDELDTKLTHESIEKALSIKDALLEELPLIFEFDTYQANLIDHIDCIGYALPEPEPTDLLIYKEAMNYNNEIDFEACLIKKESIAKWLWKNGHEELAKNIDANIEQYISNEIKQGTFSQVLPSQIKSSNSKDIRTSEYSLIDSLGVMAWLLSKKANTFKRGDKPNASEIKKHVEIVIEELELNNDEDNKIQISNLNKDISIALKQLEGKFNP